MGCGEQSGMMPRPLYSTPLLPSINFVERIEVSGNKPLTTSHFPQCGVEWIEEWIEALVYTLFKREEEKEYRV